MAMTTSSISDLPQDVLMHIFDFVNPRDRVHIQFTSSDHYTLNLAAYWQMMRDYFSQEQQSFSSTWQQIVIEIDNTKEQHLPSLAIQKGKENTSQDYRLHARKALELFKEFQVGSLLLFSPIADLSRYDEQQNGSLVQVFTKVKEQYPDLNLPESLTAHNIREWLKCEENKVRVTTISILNLEHCSLQCLPFEIGHFTQLQQLNLKWNQLTSLSPRLFYHFTQLKKLDLSRNQLTTLSPGLFNHLTQLQKLNLSYNKLSSLPPYIFDHMTQLHTLDLKWNQLTSFPPHLFDYFAQLKGLFISCNPFTSFPPGIFAYLKRSHIRCNFNPIPRHALAFPPLASMFIKIQEQHPHFGLPKRITNDGITRWLENPANQAKLSAVNSLNLIDCHLVSVPIEIGYLTQLQKLYLGRNKLISLPPHIFDNLSQLQQLDLSLNPLTFLPPHIFDNLSQLQELDLSSNPLTSLPDGLFDNLTRLQQLNLKSIRLTSLPPHIFDNLSQLQQLDLWDNKLTSLPPHIFDHLQQLQMLSLDHNKLASLPPGIFAYLKRSHIRCDFKPIPWHAFSPPLQPFSWGQFS